jgi:hypothetical protein
MNILRLNNSYHLNFEGRTIAIFKHLSQARQFAHYYSSQVDC